MKRLLVVAACVGSLVSGPGMAVAGEVTQAAAPSDANKVRQITNPAAGNEISSPRIAVVASSRTSRWSWR